MEICYVLPINSPQSAVIVKRKAEIPVLGKGKEASIFILTKEGKINHVYIENGGKGYDSETLLKTKNDAKLIPVVENGKIIDVKIINPGNGFEDNIISIHHYNTIKYENYFHDINNVKNICFIHSCNILNVGTDILDEILREIKISGLYTELDLIVINNIGIPINKNKYKDAKIKVINFSEDIRLFELPTIKLLISFSEKHPNCKLLYLHTKGVSKFTDKKTENWRKHLYININNYKECLEKLNQYDSVGTLYFSGNHCMYEHFAGNFWWANTNYLRKFNKHKLVQKYDAESFLFSLENNFYSFQLWTHSHTLIYW